MVNKVILVGRLGKDPEVRTLQNDSTVANFSIATTETYRDRQTNEKREQTEWHNIVVWRGLAKIAEKYVKKGMMVYIEGKLRTRSWEKDGITRYTTEVVADVMTMLSSSNNNNNNSQQGNSPTPQQEQNSFQSQEPAMASDDASDDLPF